MERILPVSKNTIFQVKKFANQFKNVQTVRIQQQPSLIRVVHYFLKFLLLFELFEYRAFIELSMLLHEQEKLTITCKKNKKKETCNRL